MTTVETPTEESVPAPAAPVSKAAPVKTSARQTPELSNSREELVASLLRDFQAPPKQETPPAPAKEPAAEAQVDTGTPPEAEVSEIGIEQQQTEPATEGREPEWPDSAKAAISEVRAKSRAFKDELKSVKAELEALRAEREQARKTVESEKPKEAPRAEAPDAALAAPEVQRLMQQEQAASNATRKVEKLLTRLQRGDMDGVVKDLRTTEKISVPEDITEEQLTDYLLDLRHNATEHMRHAAVKVEMEKGRAREKMAAHEREFRARADKHFPWLKDSDGDSPEHKHAQAVRERFPAISQLPDGGWWLGVVVEGLKAVDARERGTVAARPKAASSALPTGARTAPQTTGVGSSTASLLKRYQETGDPQDRAAWMKAEMAATTRTVPTS